MKIAAPAGVASCVAFSAVLCAALVTSPGAHAARTLTWSETAESLAHGTADGVAVTDSGALFLSPRLSNVGQDLPPGQPVQTWSMAADSRGNVYLGTGPDGLVLKITPTGKQEVFQNFDEPMVTALAFDGSGNLLAATSPGGRIYRIAGNGTAELWSETEARYVWDLVVLPGGTAYAAAGEPGSVFAIDRNGMVRRFFDSHDQHVMCLTRVGDDGLLAGSAGDGRVYRIDADGNGVVLYEDEMPEVVAVAAAPDGSALAALIASPFREGRRPAVRIELPGGVTTTVPVEGMQGIEEEDGSTVRGVIEGMPGSDAAGARAPQGRVVRIEPDGGTTILWRSSDEAPFALTTDAEGRALLGAGEPARLYRIGSPDTANEVALLTTLAEGQLTALLRLGRSTFMATSNPAMLYRLESHTAEGGSFLSRTFDAGGPARWGTIRWKVDGQGGRLEFFTRTGNSARPDETWSAWSPTLVDPDGSDVVNPDGRFLQWRARFVGPTSLALRVSAVEVRYEPYNRPPDLREFFVDSLESAIADDVTLRWVAIDPDRDPLDVSIEYRRDDAAGWTALERPTPPPGEDGEEAGEREDDGALPVDDDDATGGPHVAWGTERVTLKSGGFPEGRYLFRIALSDQPGNPPGEAHTIQAPQRVAVTFDRSSPEIAVRPNGESFDITVVDQHSDIARLEITEGGKRRFSLRPLDGVCDSRRETFRFVPPGGDAAAAWAARAVDAAGNAAVEPFETP